MINSLILKIRDIIVDIHNEKQIKIECKSDDKDLVTNVDKKVQHVLIDYIKELYPGSVVVGEEDSDSLQYLHHESVWIIDPIDGTANFAKKQHNFGMLLAYYENGVGQVGIIVDVCRKNIYVAKKDNGVSVNNLLIDRRNELKLKDSFVHLDPSLFELCAFFKQHCFGLRYIGACSLDGLDVLLGNAGVYLASKTGVWDMAAHHIFAKELGMKIVKLDGNNKSYYEDGPCIIFNNEKIFDECIKLGLFDLLKFTNID